MTGSVALVYQFVTGALGFKEHQHEGKITGLAAYGQPIYAAVLDEMFVADDEEDYVNGNGLRFDYSDCPLLTEEENKQALDSTIKDFGKFLAFKKKVYSVVNKLLADGALAADIASSVQLWAEQRTVRWIWKAISKERKGCTDSVCFLAGGLFANVKINQAIKSMKCFSEVMVVPAMGDEGTCVGAAVSKMLQSAMASKARWTRMNIDDLKYSDMVLGAVRGGTRIGCSNEDMVRLFENALAEQGKQREGYAVGVMGSEKMVAEIIAGVS